MIRAQNPSCVRAPSGRTTTAGSMVMFVGTAAASAFPAMPNMTAAARPSTPALLKRSNRTGILIVPLRSPPRRIDPSAIGDALILTTTG
jgi:hypothetical protein